MPLERDTENEILGARSERAMTGRLMTCPKCKSNLKADQTDRDLLTCTGPNCEFTFRIVGGITDERHREFL